MQIKHPSGVHCPRGTGQHDGNEKSSFSDGLTLLLLSQYPPHPVLSNSCCLYTIWNCKAYKVKTTVKRPER